MGFFKPTRVKVIISIVVALFTYQLPYLLTYLIPHYAYIFLKFVPDYSYWLLNNIFMGFGDNYNPSPIAVYGFMIIDTLIQVSLGYVFVCIIILFSSKLKKRSPIR